MARWRFSRGHIKDGASCYPVGQWELTREVTSFVATRWFPTVLWNPKVHYRVHKSSALVRILSHAIPPHPFAIRSILMLSTRLRLGLPSGFFPSVFLTHKVSENRS
jgi:hypothetical protein